MTAVNGYDLEKLKQSHEDANNDASTAERQPKLTAHWEGGSKTRVEMGDTTISVGGEGEMRAMPMLLASLAACEVDVIAMNATLMGLNIEDLRVEATGHYNTQSFLGVDEAAGSGYDSISYMIHLKAPQASPEQIEKLKEKCEKTSPVGDSLTKSIPLKFDIVTQ